MTYYEMLLAQSKPYNNRFIWEPGDLHTHRIESDGTKYGFKLVPEGECPGCDHIRANRAKNKNIT